MTTPELYFDPDGKPITVQQWADLRDELGKKMIVGRHSLTDRSAPTWTIFVTTGWWGIAPEPGEDPPRIYTTDAIQVGHVGVPKPVDKVPEGYAWATRTEADAGHVDVVKRLAEGLSEPVVCPWGPPLPFAGIPCPECGEKELREIARPEKGLFGKKRGTHSLSGTMTKVSATEMWVNRPYALCSACGFEKAGKFG